MNGLRDESDIALVNESGERGVGLEHDVVRGPFEVGDFVVHEHVGVRRELLRDGGHVFVIVGVFLKEKSFR